MQVYFSRLRPFRLEWAALLLITVIGFGLRLWQLHTLPPGLYHDEGFYALDAAGVLEGRLALYFPANNGREPLFIYILALFIQLFGRTTWAVRLAAVFIGTLVIPATYFLGRAMFNRRLGVMGAAIMAFTFYPVALSRVAFRAGTLPLVAALAMGVFWLAFKKNDPRRAALAGALYGLTFYTYLAARVSPVALGLFGGWLIMVWLSSPAKAYLTERWRLLKPFVGMTLLVVAPLVIYAFMRPQVFFQRMTEISVLSHPNAWVELFFNLGASFGMFLLTGDFASRPRLNIPGRAFFDPVMGTMAVVGLLEAVNRIERSVIGQRDPKTAPRYIPWFLFPLKITGSMERMQVSLAPVFMLAWVGTMLMPTMLSTEAPYFLRAVGILPFIAFSPALGMEAVFRWLMRIRQKNWGVNLAGFLLVVSLVFTVQDYFTRYAKDEYLFYSFEVAGTQLAEEINTTPDPVFVDSRYWTYYTQSQFLTRDPARVTVFEEEQPLPPTLGATLFIWPYAERWRDSLSLLPRGSIVTAHPGPLFKNDFDVLPYSFYSVYTSQPAPTGPWLATFTNGMGVQSVTVTPIPDGLSLKIIWGAGPTPGGEYHVFVQALALDRFVLAQSDGIPANELYPTTMWRPGDYVEETRVLAVAPDSQPKLIIGMYNPPTGARLVLPSGADFIEINP